MGKLKLAMLATVSAAIVIAGGWKLFGPVAGQAQGFRAARFVDGTPNLNGFWQAIGAAHWDVEAHHAYAGPTQCGALFSVPAGLGVVEGGDIPYQPWALKKRAANFEKRWALDPETKCYMPGVPRATYMPFPFQILQSTGKILMVYEYAATERTIHMNKVKSSPVDTWMGHSLGRWEGDSLVVDVTSFNDETWFDRAGNFHSDALHVTERYTPTTADHLDYEVTIEDSKVFERPWKMRMPLYRRQEKDVQLLEFKCVPFTEELLYGDLKAPSSK